MRTLLLLAVGCLFVLLVPLPAGAGSETPPEGPPWHRDLLAAQKQAIEESKPLFLYFTKTYCPHCVVVEKELLSNEAIASAYDKVVWLYVYRIFDSGNEADRAAERISLRFGVTSWPQLFLADPEHLTILEHTGRSVSSFLGAVGKTSVSPTEGQAALERTRAAEERAVELERRPTVKRARALLDDEDLVVRCRALGVLAEKDPKTVVARAVELLAVESDPFRYQVCEVLKEAADTKAARALEAIVREPTASLNPNVLRIRAVQALSTCGDAASVPFIAPHARSGAYFNGLTGQAIDALGKIAKRHADARKAVDEALRTAYPRPPGEGATVRERRACIALAKRVHKTRGDRRPFPDVYDAEARTALMAR